VPAVIVLGDRTDHGGEVIEASGVTDTHGRHIARVGDKVTCPKKGRGETMIIITGDLTDSPQCPCPIRTALLRGSSGTRPHR